MNKDNFENQLKNSTKAISYLKQRNITGETAKIFNIGYAANDYQVLNKFLSATYTEKNLLEAHLEFQYLTSPEVLATKVNENIDIKYDNLDISQIYLSMEEFIEEQKKITKILNNEK